MEIARSWELQSSLLWKIILILWPFRLSERDRGSHCERENAPCVMNYCPIFSHIWTTVFVNESQAKGSSVWTKAKNFTILLKRNSICQIYQREFCMFPSLKERLFNKWLKTILTPFCVWGLSHIKQWHVQCNIRVVNHKHIYKSWTLDLNKWRGVRAHGSRLQLKTATN